MFSKFPKTFTLYISPEAIVEKGPIIVNTNNGSTMIALFSNITTMAKIDLLFITFFYIVESLKSASMWINGYQYADIGGYNSN